MMQMTLDIQKFNASLRAVMAATKKTEAEIVTKAAKDVAFRAASFTPKAAMRRDLAKLQRGGLLPALASTACNTRYGKGHWGRHEHSNMMLAILNRRRRGIGALRAGWIPAIVELGGSWRGGDKLRNGSTAAKGFGKKATIATLTARIRNAVVTIDHKGKPWGAGEITLEIDALNKAIVFVTKDRQAYAEKKLTAAVRGATRPK